jgi:putative membrane protein
VIAMKNRNHKIVILNNFLESMKSILIFLLLSLSYSPINPFISLTVLTVLVFGFSFINWYNTYYEIYDYEIRYTKGFLNKNTTVIPISKISTVDISQNVIYQFLDIAKLKLDSGAVNIGESEIKLVVSIEKANKIKNTLGKLEATNKKDEYIKLSTNEIVKYALTRNTTAIILGIIFTINTFLDDLLKLFKIEKDFYNEVGARLFTIDNINKKFILSICILIIAGYIITKLLAIFYYILKFSNFTICRDDKCINIKYGELSKKKYSLPINKINAVTLKQNLIRQALGLYSLEISTVGYGNEDKEEAILYPICTINKAKEIIEKLVPDYNIDLELKPVNNKGKKRFFVIPMVITSIIVINLSVIFKYGYISLIIELLVFAICYFQYKNTSIGYCEEKIIATLGIFTKKIIIIKIDKVEDITISSSFFQRRDDLCTYVLNYYGKKITEVLILRHLPKSHFEKLRSKLIKC